MGETNRQKGQAVRQASKDILDALNKAASSNAWMNMRESGFRDGPPGHVYRIDEDGRGPVLAPVEDLNFRKDRREVFVALLRKQRPWMAALVVDFDAKYDAQKYAELGRWASDIATDVFPEEGRVVSASFMSHSAWPEADAIAAAESPVTWVPPGSNGA